MQFSKKMIIRSAGIGMLLVMLISSFFYFTKQEVFFSSADNNEALLQEVARVAVLPKGELPVIATVTDPAKLIGQPFFQRAEVGDKVIIFPNAHKALLYRPGSMQIVEMMLFDVPPVVEPRK